MVRSFGVMGHQGLVRLMNNDIKVEMNESKAELIHDYKHSLQFVFSEDIFDENKVEAEALCLERKFGNLDERDVYWPNYLCARWTDDKTLVVFWSEDDEERLITTKWSYNGGPETKHLDVTWQMYEPGDMYFASAGAPGHGHITFKVTRKDDTGLWGICTEDTMWVPE
jgi:hypothetical protein